METSPPTFDQLPHVVSGLSEKLDRVLELLEKAGFTGHSKQSKPSRRLVYAKEACQIIGKSLSSLYRGIKAPNDPIPSYKRGKLLYFYEDELLTWIENGRKNTSEQNYDQMLASMQNGIRRKPKSGFNL